jgi:Rrf2 family protein
MLKLSTKGRYATRILVYLAARTDKAPARKREIAGAENIPPDYVEQLLTKLRTGGLVKSRRGAAGGFLLAQDPGTISVANVLEATEGPFSLVHCVEDDCDRISECVTRPVWQEASEAIRGVFSRTSIADLASQARRLQESRSISFEI